MGPTGPRGRHCPTESISKQPSCRMGSPKALRALGPAQSHIVFHGGNLKAVKPRPASPQDTRGSWGLWPPHTRVDPEPFAAPDNPRKGVWFRGLGAVMRKFWGPRAVGGRLGACQRCPTEFSPGPTCLKGGLEACRAPGTALASSSVPTEFPPGPTCLSGDLGPPSLWGPICLRGRLGACRAPGPALPHRAFIRPSLFWREAFGGRPGACRAPGPVVPHRAFIGPRQLN